MSDAETDRGGGSMNDFSEIDRRDFFIRRSFSEGIHLPAD
jgi:hypothetical protein